MAKQKAMAAFEKMQRGFRLELNTVSAGMKIRKGTPLTSVTRGLNIARSSRNATKLNVSSQIEAGKLVRFSKYTKFLGNGLAVIDFGTRAGNVHNSYKAGGNWERDLFIESSSFVASALAGTAAVNAGGAVLSFLMVATPIGWVGLVIGGLVIAGVAAGSAIWANNKMQNNSGDWYDEIMSLVSAL